MVIMRNYILLFKGKPPIDLHLLIERYINESYILKNAHITV